MSVVPIPIPATAEQWYWLLVALSFSRGFTKQLDQSLQETKWFQRRHKFWAELLKRSMDAFHHWWAGLGLWLYADTFAAWLIVSADVLRWIGAGVFLDDVPDFVRYVKMARQLLKYLKDELAEGEGK